MKTALILVIIASLLVNVFAIPNIATWYCSLTDSSKGSCFPGSCGTYSPVAGTNSIAAMNPALFGTGSACAYKGPACGQCWKLQGPNSVVIVGITDCCAGYLLIITLLLLSFVFFIIALHSYSGHPSCLNDPTDAQCDWCASGDNNHFDLDYDTFSDLCGDAGIQAGHCELSQAVQVAC